MCPMCFTTVVLIAGGAALTGGVTAAALKGFGVQRAAEGEPIATSTEAQLKEAQHG